MSADDPKKNNKNRKKNRKDRKHHATSNAFHALEHDLHFLPLKCTNMNEILATSLILALDELKFSR